MENPNEFNFTKESSLEDLAKMNGVSLKEIIKHFLIGVKQEIQKDDNLDRVIETVLGNLYDGNLYKNKKKLNENATYSEEIDYKSKIAEVTKYMIDEGMNVRPLPKVIFKNGDKSNAKEFFGMTAYYEPNNYEIILYTEGRHPKDIVRSFCHEMIHHIQNLEDRLGQVSTTNTQEDSDLNDLESEANLKGTMTFRNWTDSVQENKKDPFGLSQYARELAQLK